MKVVFAHDHRVKLIDGIYYPRGAFSNSIFKRYLKHFSEITVICRVEEGIENDKKWGPLTLSNIKFSPINKLTDLKLKRTRNEIKKIIIENDAVIIRLPSVIGILAGYYAKKNNKSYAIELVGCPWDALWHSGKLKKILAPFFYLIIRRMVKKSPFVLYVSDKFLQRRYPNNNNNINCSNVEILENNIDILEKRYKKINKFNKRNKIIFCTVSNIGVRYKSQETIIKSIPKLIKLGYDIEYHLIGDGNDLFLKSLANKFNILNRIKFIEIIPHNQVFDLLDNIDIYVHPSKQEGLPRAIIEAMSRACPVIGSNVGGIPELLKKECIFKAGSVKNFIKTFQTIINSNLKEIAYENFQKSKNYSKNILEKRRFIYYEKFKKNAQIKCR